MGVRTGSVWEYVEAVCGSTYCLTLDSNDRVVTNLLLPSHSCPDVNWF